MSQERAPDPPPEDETHEPGEPPTPPSPPRRNFLSAALALGLSHASISFLGATPLGAQGSDGDQDCSSDPYNPVRDEDCNMPLGEHDNSCGVPGENEVWQDQRCGYPNPESEGGAYFDFDCAKPVPGEHEPALHSKDNDCGLPSGVPKQGRYQDYSCDHHLPGEPNGPSKDHACGLPMRFVPEHVFKDETCGIKRANEFERDDACGKPSSWGGTLEEDKDCEKQNHLGGGVHKDEDCGLQLPGQEGGVFTDQDCEDPKPFGGTHSDENAG